MLVNNVPDYGDEEAYKINNCYPIWGSLLLPDIGNQVIRSISPVHEMRQRQHTACDIEAARDSDICYRGGGETFLEITVLHIRLISHITLTSFLNSNLYYESLELPLPLSAYKFFNASRSRNEGQEVCELVVFISRKILSFLGDIDV